jgi:hypothetical protein
LGESSGPPPHSRKESDMSKNHYLETEELVTDA